MKVYRMAGTQFINDLYGNGSKKYGGRWNHKGTSMIYTSENRALATVEYLVHVPLSMIPTNLSLATILIPNEITPEKISILDLPGNWQEYPAPSKLCDIGTNWAAKKEDLLLRVPSAVIEHEFNILINPLHPDMKHVTIFQIEKYKVNKRLLRSENR